MQNQSSSYKSKKEDSVHQDASSQRSEDDDYKPSLFIKILIGYAYFIQGVISSIPGTAPYVYPELPDYLILSVFQFSNWPYSLKFITAPFVEKYNHLLYGKRKTWIITSQLLTSVLLIIGSFFTYQSQSLVFAWFTVAFNMAMSLQDIALDGMALKQMKSRANMSLYQSVFQNIGSTGAGMLMLKLTSLQFSQSIGLNHPITEFRWIIVGIGIALLIPTILIHFFYQQRYLRSEEASQYISIWRIILIYRCYIFPSFRYFRQGLYLLLYYQGISFFVAGYNYELIHHGFSKDTMNTIDNLNVIPLTIILFLIGQYSNYLGFRNSFLIMLGSFQLSFLYLYIWFPTNTVPVAISSFLIGFISNWDFMLSTILSAYFPISGFTSMLFTMGGSLNNGGKLNYLQTAALKIYPWRVWAVVGLIYTFIVMAITPWAMKKIEEGKTDIDQFVEDGEESYHELNDVQNIENNNHNDSHHDSHQDSHNNSHHDSHNKHESEDNNKNKDPNNEV